MRLTSLILILSASSFSQIAVNPTSTISCRNWYSTANLTISTGTPPYSFTVQTPSCTSTFTDSSTNSTKTFSLSCPGDYTITIADAFNTIGVLTHSVSLETHIKIPTYSDPGGNNEVDTICVGTFQGIEIQDTLGGNFIAFHLSQLMWSNGATSLSIMVSPTITTTYSLSGLATGTMIASPYAVKTCTVNASRKVVPVQLGQSKNCLLEGLSDELNLKGIRFYPNPAKDKLIVEFEGSSRKLNKLCITNSVGQLVFTLEEPKPKEVIDLGSLPTGLYYLKAHDPNGQAVFKLIKE